MKSTKKKGFTLTELMVVLVIMAIIVSIAVPFFINYWRNAEFRKNEENAKTVYLAAESKLTYYRSSGQWEKFRKQIENQAASGSNGQVERAVFPSDATDAVNLNDRIYTLKLDKDAEQTENNLLLQLIDDYIYDKDMLNASIAVEIDIKSGEVYSAFYGTKCKGLTYESEDKDGYLTMQKRDYDSRKERLLGYYSTEDTVNVVSLKPTKLRITTISLQNSEKLSLNWSSNVGESLEVSYEIVISKKASGAGEDQELFSMMVSPYDIRTAGWSGKSDDSTANFASVTLYDKNKQDKGQWAFPITYSDNKYSLVLDAMMSAKTQAVIGSKSGTTEATAFAETLSTSICRLAAVDSALADPQDIYATVKAISYAGSSPNVTITNEYRASEAVDSNDANSMYADATSGNDVKIAAFRHLSNMRYYDESETATFTLTNKNMDWVSVGTGVYDLATVNSGTETGNVQKLAWKENKQADVLDFPSISKLPASHTLKGKGKNTIVSNLHLGEDSIVDDETTGNLSKAASRAGRSKGKAATTSTSAAISSEYLGLFGEIEGTVEDVTLQNPNLTFGVSDGENESGTETDQKTYSALKGVGILAGRSEGTISNVAVTSTGKTDTDAKAVVNVSLADTGAAQSDTPQTAVIGGVIGAVAAESNGALAESGSARIENVSMEGNVTAELPDTDNSDAEYGIGGVVGYARLQNGSSAKIDTCTNHAAVSGNFYTGGIIGKLVGTLDNSQPGENASDTDLQNYSNVSESENDGLILCTYSDEVQGDSLKGQYFGGIVGYGKDSMVYGSSSASGRASSFKYDSEKSEMLKGQYVGGIIGYGNDTLLTNCSTETNGYILGSDYVGGIAGGLGGKISEAIRAQGGVSVTTNGSYVIGNNYVGGIVGYNASVVKNCVNNGIAASIKKYAGGIAGYNKNGAEVYDCASYLSDYNNSIFNMIVKTWSATGDYVGGIVGYNDGKITFTKDSQTITVKSVSSIVVGNNYVGGIAGFNDVNGDLDVNYTLIGGRIYAYENCAGGAFGLNASVSAMDNGLTIKPKSVEGNYFVGGCIGANIVNPQENITLKMKSDNTLGTIKGIAFCGGVIGYQSTYTSTLIEGGTNELLRDKAAKVLPTLNNDNIPQYTTDSSNDNNSHTVTINVSNNIPITAYMYAGGIVGYCEKNSKTVIKDSTNSGDIMLASGAIGESKSGTVNLGKFVAAETNLKNLSDEASNLNLHIVGGITGVNLENQIIDKCTNTGSLSGFTGIGGIVGLNAGLVYNCELKENFGNASLEYVGGIVGINAGNQNKTITYTGRNYTAGTIESCKTARNKTVSGKNNLGGIVGWNLADAIIKDSTNNANVTASGKDNTGIAGVGGIAGRNSGTVLVTEDINATDNRSITGMNGKGVGGIIGINENNGTIEVNGSADTNNEIVAISSAVTVMGAEEVGGIVGINEGQFGTEGMATDSVYLTCKAKRVRASHGTVGGIAGITNGSIYNAVNRSASVTADAGTAGGITATNGDGKVISNCKDYGSVSSSSGHAGGIVAENAGTIENCIVQGTGATKKTVIYSLNVNESGAICSENSGMITGSAPGKNVILQGSASTFGGITGVNTGTVEKATLKAMPTIESTQANLIVGGAVGQNENLVHEIAAGKGTSSLDFKEFSGYMYLGGIVGQNGHASVAEEGNSAQIKECSYSGTMSEKENTSSAGNCYGGIAGVNYSVLNDNSVEQITMKVQGVYTANSSSTTEQKEASATHAGGIAGKNESNAEIISCTLNDNPASSLEAQFGMLGGVTGFNKGTIRMSGSNSTDKIMAADEESTDQVTKLDRLVQKAQNQGLNADSGYVNWNNNNDVENLTYSSGGGKISADRLNMKMTSNGNVGGITAFNGTSGEVNQCVSGNWFIINKSEAIGVGTGGIIGMNESEYDLTYLVNGAFVARQVSAVNGKEGQTNRFAGGIIGNQNNTTSHDWEIRDCINFGTVYCYRTHYSGGIIGQWTASGGTLKECRNYGNLQTTFAASWIGASGGIVAQLYYAYEDNEYNIIGCGNYGSIYMRNGASVDDSSTGANDSAGILGNITTYKISDAEKSQRFTVQILDCVNAPGVEIYSESMASGIFGFLSCDNVDNSGNAITNATSNVTIRIERCRNFANVLKGKNFVAGIFGDRYGADAWKDNTIVKDCYSLNLDENHYNKTKYAIYSAASEKTVGRPPAMLEENRKNNFYIDGIGSWGFTNITIAEGSASGNNVSATNGLDADGLKFYARGAGQTASYATDTFIMKNITKNKYIAVYIYPKKTVRGDNCYIAYKDGYGYVYDSSNNQIGEVLYEIGDINGYKAQSTTYLYDDITVDNQNTVFLQSRSGYGRLEGISTAGTGQRKILPPKSATAEIKNGKISVSVTPQNIGNTEQLYDPFAYVVTVTDSNNNKAEHTIYTEEGSFDIPSGMSGTLSVSVRAKSMYDDVEESEETTATTVQSGKILPTPDVRAELIVTNNDYRYQFSLNNLDEYKDYDGWKVQVSLNTYSEKVTLNASNPTGVLNQSLSAKRNDEDNFYQIQAQAIGDAAKKLESSALISTTAYMPYYQAFISLNTTEVPNVNDSVTNVAATNPSITGDTLDTLSVSVEIDNGNSSKVLQVTPIYRAELIGDWNGQKDVVFAKQDIMTVSKGKASATFTNLPEYIRKATNLHVRLWYAQTGLGPVYLYHEENSEGNANIKELEKVDKDGTETWTYTQSIAISNPWRNFERYTYTSDTLFTWLPAPVLDLADGSNLSPTYDNENRMQYVFSWDKDLTDSDLKYELSLTGIDETGKEVTIDTSGFDGGRSFTVDGEDWNYKQIRIKVTRVGDASQGKIGLSTTATYNVAQRLEKPGQPTVTNIDENELNYRISWSKISDETYCKDYQIYIRQYDDQGNLGAAEKIGTAEPATGAATYSQNADLEKYAGKRIVVYLVAESNDTSVYVDSAPGVTYELEIPSRLDPPNVTWSVDWNYSLDAPMEAAEFQSGDMTVSLSTNDSASIPPGGSAYLMKAYVYDSKDEADAAIEKATGADADTSTGNSFITEYPEGDDLVQMDVTDAQNYYHDIQDLSIKYAGKWIVFYARISSGGGNISSFWTKSDAYRLPYVKLAQPEVSSDTKEYTVTANVKETPNVPGTDQEWTALHSILKWESVDCADMYSVNLKGEITDSTAASKNTVEPQFRILEKPDGDSGDTKIEVQQYVYRKVQEKTDTQDEKWDYIWEDITENASDYEEDTPETEKVHTFDLSNYSVPVSSSYTAENGAAIYYELTLTAQLEAQKKEDGGYSYTLKLPDVEQLTAEDGITITQDEFKVTKEAAFTANVMQNLEDTKSEFYAESDKYEIKWEN